MQSGCVSEATSVSFPGSAIFDLIVRTVTITSFFDQLRELSTRSTVKLTET